MDRSSSEDPLPQPTADAGSQHLEVRREPRHREPTTACIDSTPKPPQVLRASRNSDRWFRHRETRRAQLRTTGPHLLLRLPDASRRRSRRTRNALKRARSQMRMGRRTLPRRRRQRGSGRAARRNTQGSTDAWQPVSSWPVRAQPGPLSLRGRGEGGPKARQQVIGVVHDAKAILENAPGAGVDGVDCGPASCAIPSSTTSPDGSWTRRSVIARTAGGGRPSGWRGLRATHHAGEHLRHGRKDDHVEIRGRGRGVSSSGADDRHGRVVATRADARREPRDHTGASRSLLFAQRGARSRFANDPSCTAWRSRPASTMPPIPRRRAARRTNRRFDLTYGRCQAPNPAAADRRCVAKRHDERPVRGDEVSGLDGRSAASGNRQLLTPLRQQFPDHRILETQRSST